MEIIFQDASLIVADKPPGIESENFVKRFKVPLDRGGLGHRLDKGTSGLLVIAKKQYALENLQQQFRDHQIKKVYTTLVYGKMDQKQGVIEVEIARDTKRKQAMKAIPFAIGQARGKRREAATEWGFIQKFQMTNDKFPIKSKNQTSNEKKQNQKIAVSLLKVKIHTGRTHQIRVHMQYIGHPVLGDPMYNTKESRKISKLLGLNRQFLHATELGFTHPGTGLPAVALAKAGEWVEFRSELPNDLQLILSKLNHESRSRSQIT